MRIHQVLAVLCAIVSVSISGTNATTVVPPTFDEMVDRADLVFIGKVIDSRSEWRSVGTNRAILTFVSFETRDVLKGTSRRSVTLQFLGGTVGDATLEVAGVPRFSAGESAILFVEGNGLQLCPIVGFFHGKFGLRNDQKSGRDIVLMHDGKPLRDLGEIGAGEGAEFRPKRVKPSIPADREPMSVDEFKECIRLHLAKKSSQ